LARWGLICVVGLLLAACGTSREEDSERRQAEGAGTGAAAYTGSPEREADVRAKLGRLRAAQSGEQEDEPPTTGLTGPEIYRGTGVLARDPARGAADVVLGENGKVTLNFANAEIRDVLDIVLGETLNLSYIIDPAVGGTITVRTSQPLSRAAVIPALENILALNGMAMTLVDGTYMIVPREVAARELSGPLVAPTDRQLVRGFGITIVPLNYASAASMLEVLEPFVGPGSLRADAARNLLIFSGSGRQARDLMDMVDVFDVDWMRGMSFALFPLDVAEAKTLVADLEAVFLQDGKSPLAGLIRFAPIERLNAVLAISPQPAYLDRAQLWIERLDRGAEGAGRRIFVYYVENGRAEDLAKILSDVFEGDSGGASQLPSAELAPGLSPVELIGARTRRTQPSQPSQPSQPPAEGAEPTAQQAQPVPQPTRRELQRIQQSAVGQAVGGLVQESGDIRVIADEANNALVILATATEFRMIEATLKKLDIIPLQVLIEATILEVQLNDELEYGVEWFFGSGNFSIGLGPISTLTPSGGFTALFENGDDVAVINALSDVTDIKVISSPQLMVLDNQSARLQVGDQLPFQSGTILTGDDTDDTRIIQQIDTGVILDVTPRINAGGLVVLEIVQEVSTVSEEVGVEDNPIIQQRQIESTVAVQSGETLALGGLIRDNESVSVKGLPILMEIPILGNLFKSTVDNTTRTELLVLITPRVVRNSTEARKVTNELRKRLKSIEPLEQKVFGPQEPSF
jgi:general secretion pathway protein D